MIRWTLLILFISMVFLLLFQRLLSQYGKFFIPLVNYILKTDHATSKKILKGEELHREFPEALFLECYSQNEETAFPVVRKMIGKPFSLKLEPRSTLLYEKDFYDGFLTYQVPISCGSNCSLEVSNEVYNYQPHQSVIIDSESYEIKNDSEEELTLLVIRFERNYQGKIANWLHKTVVESLTDNLEVAVQHG